MSSKLYTMLFCIHKITVFFLYTTVYKKTSLSFYLTVYKKTSLSFYLKVFRRQSVSPAVISWFLFLGSNCEFQPPNWPSLEWSITWLSLAQQIQGNFQSLCIFINSQFKCILCLILILLLICYLQFWEILYKDIPFNSFYSISSVKMSTEVLSQEVYMEHPALW